MPAPIKTPRAYPAQISETWSPIRQGGGLPEIVRYATLAANGHNTQPWKFAIRNDRIDIYPDVARRLPVVDPQDRALWISLGCALENLVIAARAEGYECEVSYPGGNAGFISVQMARATPAAGALFDAIPLRQNIRSEFARRPVGAIELAELDYLPLEPGVHVRFVTEPAGLEKVLEYVIAGTLIQYADKAFREELIYWLRFNDKEALASRDGLSSKCSGNPAVPRWLGSIIVSGTKPRQLADADARKLRSSAGALIVASETDDRVARVRTGRAYERLALLMTSLDIKSAFLNQPIEVAELRGQLQTAMALGTLHPQLLVRFGYAAAMPQSLRRPVEQVLI